MCFKACHALKISMTYKAEGDGLQTHAIFQKGYTYQIFVCNDLVSKSYLSNRLSPLDTRVMDLFYIE